VTAPTSQPVGEGAAAGQHPPRVRRRSNLLLLAGPALSIAGLVSYFTHAARFPAWRDAPWPNGVATFAGAAMALVGTWRAFRHPGEYRGRIAGPLATLVAAGAAGLFHHYLFVLSADLPTPTAVTLALGRAPAFELFDQDGRTVRLADFAGKKLVIVFYRGSW
jgi:hypothetical protein